MEKHKLSIPPKIARLIEGGENSTLDFKQTVSNVHKIAKTMCSFANTKGGVLLIGVRDNGSIAGIKSEDEIYMLDLAAQFYCKPALNIEIELWKIGNKEIIECKIPLGKEQPYFAQSEDKKWWAYVRVNDKSLLASKVVLDVMKRNHPQKNTFIKYSSKEKALLEYLKKNERITLQEYRKMLNISKHRASKILVNLISTGIIRNHTTEKTEFYTLV
ncbi:MAG: RNA-binding domain-containing protein [Bacteroidota bacterium]|nr:RNA-binding domain-containing protein [Bacteroidota bacterium]